MSFRINTNIENMMAKKYADFNNVGLEKSLNALSTGLRINSFSDDAAGMAIAHSLSAQSYGLGQALSNANDSIGLVQTADGALDEYSNIVNKIRTLGVQGANDTNTVNSRNYIGTQINRLQSELDHIAHQTQYNDRLLLSHTGVGVAGSSSNTTIDFTFHIGAYKNDVATVKVSEMAVESVFHHRLNGLSTQASAENIISMMDSAARTIDGVRSTLGSAQNQLEATVRNISVAQINIAAAKSQILDVDFASESANFTKHNILAKSGSFAIGQANTSQENVLRLLQPA